MEKIARELSLLLEELLGLIWLSILSNAMSNHKCQSIHSLPPYD